MADKPTVAELIPLVRKLYNRHPAGCCLHVLLDDGNVEDSDAAFAVEYAKEKRHKECQHLAEQIAKLSQTQRRKLRREAFYGA